MKTIAVKFRTLQMSNTAEHWRVFVLLT